MTGLIKPFAAGENYRHFSLRVFVAQTIVATIKSTEATMIKAAAATEEQTTVFFYVYCSPLPPPTGCGWY